MRESRVVTEIWWEPSQGFDVRGSLLFSDDALIRLDPLDHRIKLKVNPTTFRYSTAANVSARSRTYEPDALRTLLALEVHVTLPLDSDGDSFTSIGLRIFDGTNELWWDGGAWAIAGAGEWNTEADVNANLPTFDASARKFAVVLNLVTTDDRFTPEVSAVHVLWRGPIDWTQDVLIDSLVGRLQDELVYVEDFALPPLPADSASIDIDDYTDDARLVISDVDAVFDDTADPTHAADLLSAYDAGTRVITLTAPIPLGNRPFVRALAKPAVAWDTSQDFTEVARLPEIVLRDAAAPRSSQYPLSAESRVVNRDTGAAVKTQAPYRVTFVIQIEVRVDRSRTQVRVLDEIMRFFQAGPAAEVGPFLRSVATDRRYRLRLIDEFSSDDDSLNLADVRTFRAECTIEDTALDLRPARDLFAVTRLALDFVNIRSDEAAEAEAAEAPIPTTVPETVEVT